MNLTFNIHSVQNSFKMDKIDKIDALFVAKSTSVPGLGGGGGVKPILAMPGFWTLWLLQSLPYLCCVDTVLQFDLNKPLQILYKFYINLNEAL